MLAGRWLQAGDTRQVVVNDDFLEREPDVKVGSEIKLKVGDVERAYEVVGIVSKHLSGPRVYMDLRHVRQTDRAAESGRLDPRARQRRSHQRQRRAGSHRGALEQHFKDAGLSTAISQTQHSTYEMFTSAFDIILMVLVIMAGLLAVVGALSLTGTMGMNMLERTREIGVLRAVGASNPAVRQGRGGGRRGRRIDRAGSSARCCRRRSARSWRARWSNRC